MIMIDDWRLLWLWEMVNRIKTKQLLWIIIIIMVVVVMEMNEIE